MSQKDSRFSAAMRHGFFRALKGKRMRPNVVNDPSAKPPWLEEHPLSEQDSVRAAALRSAVAPMKGTVEGTAGRGLFNEIMERVAVPEGVTFDAAAVGGTSGWWARPAGAQKE